MIELNFGSQDKRSLRVLLYKPYGLWNRMNNDFHLIHQKGNNHRCYCPVGRIFDGRFCIGGWGVTFSYSTYDGEIPCVCDMALKEFMVTNNLQ